MRVVLTPRMLEVAPLVCDGLSNKEIAERLGIVPSTAKFHVDTLLREFGAKNRAHVAAIFTRALYSSGETPIERGAYGRTTLDAPARMLALAAPPPPPHTPTTVAVTAIAPARSSPSRAQRVVLAADAKAENRRLGDFMFDTIAGTSFAYAFNGEQLVFARSEETT